MKKIIAALVALMVLLSSAALAEDLSSLSDSELMELYVRVTEEMANRNQTGRDETPESADPDEDIRGSLLTFFTYWSNNDLDEMLALCSSDWKAQAETPRMELFALLANRTPLSVWIVSVSGKPEDEVRTVTVNASIDRNNGKPARPYRLQVVMKKEAYGLWFVDPCSLLTWENAEEAPREEPTPEPPEETREVSDSTVLYYVPEAGEYYHLDPNCKLVNEKYLPMSVSFTYGELEEEQYRYLEPCGICGAPGRPEDSSLLVFFEEEFNAAGIHSAIGGNSEYFSVVMEKDGKYIREVTLLDDHAKELYLTAMRALDGCEVFEMFKTYVRSLPVSFTEELAGTPVEQAELDALAGKTIGDLEKEGYFIYGTGGGTGLPTIIDMTYGLYNYEFTVDASFEEYQQHQDADDYGSLTIKSGRFSGFSSLSVEPDSLPADR